MKSKRGFCLLPIAAVLLICPALFAQTASTGSIKGTVLDEAGPVIPDVIVHAVSSTTGIQRSSVTDGTGNYNLSLLPPGTYQLEFSAKGFKTASPRR